MILKQVLKKIGTIGPLELTRTFHWENQGGKWPDYAVTDDNGKSNTFGYYQYAIKYHAVWTKDSFSVMSVYSFDDAAGKLWVELKKRYPKTYR